MEIRIDAATIAQHMPLVGARRAALSVRANLTLEAFRFACAAMLAITKEIDALSVFGTWSAALWNHLGDDRWVACSEHAGDGG
jgi:hypothetical protein